MGAETAEKSTLIINIPQNPFTNPVPSVKTEALSAQISKNKTGFESLSASLEVGMMLIAVISKVLGPLNKLYSKLEMFRSSSKVLPAAINEKTI